MSGRADKYRIAAIPTRYAGVLFRSRLEARYAAFFDLAGWAWEYEPFDLPGWVPDFLVRFPCGHSECPPEHVILAEVKPYTTLDEFKGHPCLDYHYGHKGCDEKGDFIDIPADASAALGYHPRVSYWEMGHGNGGGECDLSWALDRTYQARNMDDLWNRAAERVMYRPPV